MHITPHGRRFTERRPEPSPAQQLARAVVLLGQARELAKAAGAPLATAGIRRAIRSTKADKRAADLAQTRAQQLSCAAQPETQP